MADKIDDRRGEVRSARSLIAALTAVCTVALAITSATPVWANTTIGNVAPATPPSFCSSQFDTLQPSVASGTAYVVPAGGGTIVSWRTYAAIGAGQQLTFKVFRKVGDPANYAVVAHNGPRELTGGVLNTFPVSIPVQAGDLIGVNSANAASQVNACIFDAGAASGSARIVRPGDLADGLDGAFSPIANTLVPNVSAEIAPKAATGQRAAALKKCKKKKKAKTRKKCRNKAKRLPV